MNLQLKSLTAGVAALLFMSGIFANLTFAAATPRPVITSPSTKSCVVGTVCTYTITATNSPTSYSATGLQAWQTRSTNVITGTATTAGTFSVTVSATNAGGTGSLVVAFTVTLPPAARVVVAKSGGDYTSITAAINQTTTRPIVIEVWPGVYTEPGTINLQSDMHIKGSGPGITTVQTSKGATANVFEGFNLTRTLVTGLNIKGGQVGIFAGGLEGSISDNWISNNQVGIALLPGTTAYSARVTGNRVFNNSANGIQVTDTAIVADNVFSGNGSSETGTGIFLYQAVNPIVSGNTLTGNIGSGIQILDTKASTISNNTITNNSYSGVWQRDITVGGTVTNNTIVNNGVDVLVDDFVAVPGAPGTPNMSFNTFDNIAGTRGVGSYNVKSNGDPILVP